MLDFADFGGFVLLAVCFHVAEVCIKMKSTGTIGWRAMEGTLPCPAAGALLR